MCLLSSKQTANMTVQSYTHRRESRRQLYILQQCLHPKMIQNTILLKANKFTTFKMEFSLVIYRIQNDFSISRLLCKWRYLIMWLVRRWLLLWGLWKSQEALVGKCIDRQLKMTWGTSHFTISATTVFCMSWLMGY